MPDGGVRTTLNSPFSILSPANSLTAQFSPGQPIKPDVNYPLRAWDFPVNVNTIIRPRPYEPFDFANLRAFSNVELIRLAIETRKDQLERQDWAIKPRDNEANVSLTDPRIKTLTAFWMKPDGVNPFASFMRSMVEDLLSIDAPCAEMRRTRGGKLIALEPIPGDTIAIKVDDTGRRPRDPKAVAFQQVIKGQVWADLGNRDLLYVPRNVRPGHVYGYSPTEQIVVTINTIIRRQAAQLAHFTASNIPSGLLNAPDGWDLVKIKELQDWLDDKITGNSSEQAKILWGPAGSKYQAFKDSPLKDDFDEWLARVVASAFSLPPTPFIRQMNKGTAGQDQDRAMEEGLEPLKLWAKRWIDALIADEFNSPDLEFVFIETPNIDPGKQSTIDNENLRNGSVTIDEVRDARGQDPLPDGLGALPLIYTAQGAVMLKDVLNPPEPTPAIVTPPMPQAERSPAGAVEETPAGGAKAPAKTAPNGAKTTPNGAKTAKLAKAAPISPDRPKARRATASIAKALKPILAKTGDEVAADVAKALQALEKDATPDNATIATRITAKIDLSRLAGIRDAMEEDLRDLFSDSGELAVTAALDSEMGGIVDKVFQRAVDYARERAAALVSVDGDESVVASTRNMIRDTITRGLEQNIGKDAIAESLQGGYAFSAQRAELIAHTEIATANGQGKKAGWDEVVATGVEMVKSWFVSADEGVCEDCDGNEAEGEIPYDDAFQSGDDMEPGHPGCRCVTAARVIADDGTETDSSDE